MKTHTYIYALLDPDTRDVHYIGKTDDMAKRLKNHLQPAALKIRCRRTSWLKGLLKKGKKPLMVMLEEVEQEHWKQKECYWIAFYRALGAHLMNTAEGGGGGVKPEWITPEMRGNMRAAQLGKKRSAESIQKQIAARLGVKRKPETILKMSLANKGKAPSEATKQAQREAVAKNYVVTSPDGVEIRIKNLKQFCRENSLDVGNMCGIAKGTLPRKTHKGWRCRKADE